MMLASHSATSPRVSTLTFTQKLTIFAMIYPLQPIERHLIFQVGTIRLRAFATDIVL